SHGFVVIASDSPRVTATLMRRGIDWLLAEHEGSGAMAGALAPACAVTLGHSLGGGAALGAGSHPSVVATVSLHGVEGSLRSLQGALLLLTSTDDGSVPRDRVTLPLFEAS